MIRAPLPFDPTAPVIVIDVGNTRTTVGTWHNNLVNAPLSVLTKDHQAFEEALGAHLVDGAPGRPVATVIASVVPEALERIRVEVLARMNRDALVVGEDIELPIDVAVDDRKAIGVDRVCAAAAAFQQLQAGCTIVSFGTAVTVDLVNDDGELLGGAILPGVRLQLRALHEFTAVLPEVEPAVPELPYGRNTTEAMQNGVCRGIAGAVRGLVESYAAHLNQWPHVVATGGDLELLQPHCDFLDTCVHHLCLRGVGLAFTQHLEAHGA